MKLIDLATKHPYYCSESNYYSNEAGGGYATMTEFLNDFENSDVDMNLVFRWDVKKNDEATGYYAQVFIIHQRKGIFAPYEIVSITEDEVNRFCEYLKKHQKALKDLWSPMDFTKATGDDK